MTERIIVGWVLKHGPLYANGRYGWGDRAGAFVFAGQGYKGGPRGIKWARGHRACMGLEASSVRVVRIVRVAKNKSACVTPTGRTDAHNTYVEAAPGGGMRCTFCKTTLNERSGS